MLEGGGRTPIISPIELADVGYKIVAYPLSLMGVSIRAMQVFQFFLSFLMPDVLSKSSGFEYIK